MLDEVNTNQLLTDSVNLDGTTYAAGTTIHSAYDLINSATGHKVTSLHFGGTGQQQGAVHGLISTIPLVAGTSCSFNQERTSHRKTNTAADYFACFVDGTLIETHQGEIPVEALKEGDLTKKSDGSYQPLRRILHRTLCREELEALPKLRPIRLKSGSLGKQLSKRDLLVSPQHRMLINSVIAERMTGTDEVLVAANKLTPLGEIFVDQAMQDLTYFHLVLDKHQIIFAESGASESFFCGPNVLKAISPEVKSEIVTLFLKLLKAAQPPNSARPILEGRHQKNSKPLFAQ